MTTVDKVHDIFMSFKGRSPQQIYADASREHGAKVNSAFFRFLSAKVDDFHYLEDLDLAGNYFGPKGCLAVLAVVQCQQRLKSLNLSQCGVDDDVVSRLVEVMQDHPRLRSIDLSGNELISVYSGKGLSRAVKLNVGIVDVMLSGTHIGRNVAGAISDRCSANLKMMEDYFSDDWFRMKDMFLGLDVDGSGWVNIKNVVGSVVFPLVQEKLIDRIQIMKPKKREDNSIDINTFLELTYLNYKPRAEILRKAQETTNAEESNIRANWKLFAAAIAKHGQKVEDLHKFRIRHRTLAAADVDSIVETAVASAKSASASSSSGDAAAALTCRDLHAAYTDEKHRHLLKSQEQAKRARRSFMNRLDRKSWRLPAVFVRSAMELFNQQQSASGVPSTMLPVSTVLSHTFESDLEWLRLDTLKTQFAKFSIPLDETGLTVEEVVNLLDEYYDVVRVPKALPLQSIS